MESRLSVTSGSGAKVLTVMAVSLVFVVICTYQVQSAFLPRSIWLDEAWVVNAASAPSLWGAIYYDDWAQTSPPGFVALIRLFAGAVEIEQLRLIPIGFATVSAVLFAWLSVRILSIPLAAAAFVVVFTSPHIWIYAQIVKPYATDLFAAMAISVVGLHALKCDTARGLVAWFIVFFLCSLLSYVAVMFAPGFLIASWLRTGRAARSSSEAVSALSVVLTGLGVALVWLVLYFLIIAPNADVPTLRTFWSSGFFSGSGESLLRFYYEAAYALIAAIPFLPQEKTVVVVTWSLIAVGATSLWFRPPDVIARRAFWLTVAPLVTLFAVNAAGFYPVGEVRMTLFLMPTVVLLLFAGLERILYAVRLDDSGMRLVALSVVLATGAWVRVNVDGAVDLARRVRSAEDVRGALEYLSSNYRPADTLLVHASMNQQIKAYGAEHFGVSGPVVWGDQDWPCCGRGRVYDVAAQELDKVREEALAAVTTARPGMLWVIFSTARTRAFKIDNYRHALETNGCEEKRSVSFTGVRLLLYQCS